MKTIEFSPAGHRVVFFLCDDPSSPARHLNENDLSNVAAYLSGDYRGPRHLCGRRSVFIPTNAALPYDGLKIKGAGFEGGPVRFGRLHPTRYSLPRYDFDGNFMADQAKNMCRAPSGGMSRQQAVNEYAVSEAARKGGVLVPPALGYGFVERAARRSWFCLINMPYRKPVLWLEDVANEEQAVETAQFYARSLKEFQALGIYLLLIGRIRLGGRLARKDLHTCHFAGPNDSFMSLLCYTFFDMNFTLYLMKRAYRINGAGDFRDAARVAYVEEMTGRRFTVAEIERFKKLLLRFKYGPGKRWGVLPRAPLTIDDRVALVRTDPIASILLDRAVARDAEARLTVD